MNLIRLTQLDICFFYMQVFYWFYLFHKEKYYRFIMRSIFIEFNLQWAEFTSSTFYNAYFKINETTITIQINFQVNSLAELQKSLLLQARHVAFSFLCFLWNFSHVSRKLGPLIPHFLSTTVPFVVMFSYSPIIYVPKKTSFKQTVSILPLMLWSTMSGQTYLGRSMTFVHLSLLMRVQS